MSWMRGVLFAAGVAVLVGASGVAASGAADGLHKVSVRAGATTHGVNAQLGDGSAVGGQVTDEANHPIASAEVQVFGPNDSSFGTVFTDSNGDYTVDNLPASNLGYVVCASGQGGSVSGGGVSYGYVSACHDSSALWLPGQRPPSDAAPLATRTDETTTVDFMLGDAGGIQGAVTKRSDGTGVAAFVYLYTSAGRELGSYYASDGNYALSGITPGDYRLCFAAALSSSTSTGYVPRCYQDQPWRSGSRPPANADPVSVAADAATTADQALPTAAAISGTIRTAGKHGHPTRAAEIEVFSHGKPVTFDGPDQKGKYRVTGLAPGKYQVCALPTRQVTIVEARAGLERTQGVSEPGSTNGEPTPAARQRKAERRVHAALRAGATGQCWKSVAWSGRGSVPGKARAVSAKAGRTHAGIDLRVHPVPPPPSAVAGRITRAKGAGVAHADVVVFRPDGRFVAEDQANKHGSYHARVPASPKTGYVVCAEGPRTLLLRADARKVQPALGARCWKNVAWAGDEAPKQAPAVTVAKGRTHKGIDIVLPLAGSIAGTVSYAGQPVADVGVYGIDARGGYVAFDQTDTNGRYTLVGISPGQHEYFVCFSTSGSDTTLSPTYGFQPQCYRNDPWIEIGAP